MEGIDNEAMMKQAQNIWTMLDDMASNDPQAYKKFIDKQIKEGKSVMEHPTPHMAVKTKLIEPSKDDLFVNFCNWSRVPEPKTSEDPVPVTGVAIDSMDDQTGHYQMTSVAFNPKVLEQYGRDSSNLEDRDTLVNLAFDYIENQHKVKLSRRYKILSKDILHKGCLKHIQNSFASKSQSDKYLKSQLEQLEKSYPGMVPEDKDSLLDQLASIVVSDEKPEKPSTNTKLKMPFDEPKKSKANLIQELSSETKPLAVPKYSIETIKSDYNLKQLQVKISLQGVISIKDCDLEISQEDIALEVADLYKLHLDLPHPCDEEAATAKFNKKMGLLTITMPYKM